MATLNKYTFPLFTTSAKGEKILANYMKRTLQEAQAFYPTNGARGVSWYDEPCITPFLRYYNISAMVAGITPLPVDENVSYIVMSRPPLYAAIAMAYLYECACGIPEADLARDNLLFSDDEISAAAAEPGSDATMTTHDRVVLANKGTYVSQRGLMRDDLLFILALSILDYPSEGMERGLLLSCGREQRANLRWAKHEAENVVISLASLYYTVLQGLCKYIPKEEIICAFCDALEVWRMSVDFDDMNALMKNINNFRARSHTQGPALFLLLLSLPSKEILKGITDELTLRGESMKPIIVVMAKLLNSELGPKLKRAMAAKPAAIEQLGESFAERFKQDPKEDPRLSQRLKVAFLKVDRESHPRNPRHEELTFTSCSN